MTRNELKTTLLLGSIFAFRMLGLFMILPIFSLAAKQLPHATPTLIGFALGIYGLTQALFQLPFGVWSDFISRKKVIAIGLCLFVLGSIVAALSHNIYGIIIGRALQGSGAIGSVIIALLGDLTSEQTRTQAVGVMGITIGVSFILAIILGPSLGQLIGLSGLFWLTACFALIGLWIVWKGIPTSLQKKRPLNFHQIIAQLKYVLSHATLLRLDLSVFMAHMILTATFFALPIVLTTHYHITLNQQSKIYLPIFILSLLFIGGCMRQKNFYQKESNWLIVNTLFLLISQFILSLTVDHSRLYLYVGLYLFLQSFTFLEALLPSMVSREISMDFRGSATGVFSSCQFFGIFCGGLWSGFLAAHTSLNYLFIGNSILALLWLLIVLPLRFGKKSF